MYFDSIVWRGNISHVSMLTYILHYFWCILGAVTNVTIDFRILSISSIDQNKMVSSH